VASAGGAGESLSVAQWSPGSERAGAAQGRGGLRRRIKVGREQRGEAPAPLPNVVPPCLVVPIQRAFQWAGNRLASRQCRRRRGAGAGRAARGHAAAPRASARGGAPLEPRMVALPPSTKTWWSRPRPSTASGAKLEPHTDKDDAHFG
jgi:hypothetical protein